MLVKYTVVDGFKQVLEWVFSFSYTNGLSELGDVTLKDGTVVENVPIRVDVIAK